MNSLDKETKRGALINPALKCPSGYAATVGDYETGTLKYYYIASGDEFFTALASEFEDRERLDQSIQSYEPERRVLFLVVEEDSELTFYDLECRPEPRLA